MRSWLPVCRSCAQQGLGATQRAGSSGSSRLWINRLGTRRFTGAAGPSPWSQPRGGSQSQTGRRLLLSASTGAAVLGAGTFLELSKDGNASDEKDAASVSETGEQRMLSVSRGEMESRAEAKHNGESGRLQRIIYLLDVYVWEPVCTGLRFLQLVVIFVPVIAAVPALWIGRRREGNERSGSLWWYGFLVRAMELAGPAFVKLGQWAASRSDIFPTAMCDIMSRLHSNSKGHSLQATRRIVEEAFGGRDFDDIFDEFDPRPLGVGAIAQVYKAKLKPDLAGPVDSDLTPHESEGGDLLRQSLPAMRRSVQKVLKSSPARVPSSYVAVKVLHPAVERTVSRDLRIMGFFAAVLNAIPTMEWLSLPDEVAQFGEMMRLQLDLRIEAANLVKFRRNFRERTTASFPYPYTDWATRNVLVEEFAQGIPIADFMDLGGGVFQHDIADEGLDAFLRMLLLDNFVHADLHPGNIMVRFYQAASPERDIRRALGDHDRQPSPEEAGDVTGEMLRRLGPYRDARDRAGWEAELRRIDAEGYRPQLVFIDTGLVTELNSLNRDNFLALFRAVAEFDGYKAGHLMCERCRQPDAVLDQEVFALKMQHLVLGVKSNTLALGNVRIGDILQQVLSMVRTHHVRVEGDFVNVVISILLLEGIGRSLDPDLDLLSSSLPILRQLSSQSGAQMAKRGDFSMVLVWMGLEARRFMQASIEDVERCVKYDLLAPNV